MESMSSAFKIMYIIVEWLLERKKKQKKNPTKLCRKRHLPQNTELSSNFRDSRHMSFTNSVGWKCADVCKVMLHSIPILAK